MRLDKFLVEAGLGSRTEVKQLIKKKQVLVNGTVEQSSKCQVDEKTDQVVVAGETMVYQKFLYYLLNKPQGVISATEDAQHQTVLDLLDDLARKRGVFPVGRLDMDTHGLLLLTNNGALAHAMLSPKKHVEKLYQAQIDGVMTETDIQHFAEGIVLKDFTCQPARLKILEIHAAENRSLVEISISEGKFHQVKRMVQACGKIVVDLKRVGMGPLTLPSDLAVGEFRFLTPQERERLAVFGVEL